MVAKGIIDGGVCPETEHKKTCWPILQHDSKCAILRTEKDIAISISPLNPSLYNRIFIT